MKQGVDIEQANLNNLVKEGAQPLAIEQQKAVLATKQLELLKASYGVQRSSIEKLLGSAIGEIGKMGIFKRGSKAQLYGTGYTDIAGSGMVSTGAQSLMQRQGVMQAGVAVGGSASGVATAPMGTPTGTTGATQLNAWGQQQQTRTSTDQITAVNDVAKNTSCLTDMLKAIQTLNDRVDRMASAPVKIDQESITALAAATQALKG